MEIRQEHIFPYVVAKYVQYEYEMEPWFKAMPEAMLRILSEMDLASSREIMGIRYRLERYSGYYAAEAGHLHDVLM